MTPPPTLGTLAAEWRHADDPPSDPSRHISEKCSNDNHGWCHNRNVDESHCKCACHYGKGEGAKARRACADDLDARLVALLGQLVQLEQNMRHHEYGHEWDYKLITKWADEVRDLAASLTPPTETTDAKRTD